MTPKEKAEEIFNKMYNVDDIMGNYPMCFATAKKCALIAVDEILEYICRINIAHQRSILNDADWLKVKDELNSLQLIPPPHA